MDRGYQLFRVRLFVRGEGIEGGVMAETADEAMANVRREGASHALSFFFLRFEDVPPVDEFKIYDDNQTELLTWRTGWLRLRLAIARHLRLESVLLSDRIYHRRLP